MNNDEGLLRRVARLEIQVKEIIKILDEIDERLRDMNMDIDDLFQDIEGVVDEYNN